MDNKVTAKAIRLASTRLASLKSERDELSEKIGKLMSELDEQKKEARARDIAMKLILDEDVSREISDKTAQLKVQDLDVVEKAMSLDLLRKEATIGTGLDSGPTGKTGDALMDYLTNWSKARSKGGN